jgi:hypothetical protein
VFTNGSFTTAHPLDLKAKVARALTEFANKVGMPDFLLSDGSPKIAGPRTDFMKEVSCLKIKLKQSEVGQSNQNYGAEREIGELKKQWRNCMLKRKVSPCLWDYGLVYETNILNRTPRRQQQRTGIEVVTGKTPDISEWIDIEFYDRVWYYDQKKIEIDGSDAASRDCSVLHTGLAATNVIGYYLSLEKLLPVLQSNTLYATTI